MTKRELELLLIELSEMHDIYKEIKSVIALDPQNSIAKSLAYENIKKIIEER